MRIVRDRHLAISSDEALRTRGDKETEGVPPALLGFHILAYPARAHSPRLATRSADAPIAIHATTDLPSLIDRRLPTTLTARTEPRRHDGGAGCDRVSMHAARCDFDGHAAMFEFAR